MGRGGGRGRRCVVVIVCDRFVSVLKMEDTLRSHHFYFEAATNAIEVRGGGRW